ncbi:MAG: transketolase family protein [Planctomycetota bacterium]|nr:transketolase family protein [Planctomycetota bacterium]
MPKIEFPMGKATRDAYGKALLRLGKEMPNLVVLDADLSKSTRTSKFQEAFPDRFFNIGIAEANMAGIAAGLASSGKVPFISSFACFLMNKAFDQLRMCVAYPNINVKVAVTHAGISIGEDGPSQQGIEDVALALALPGFVVLVPADEVAAEDLVAAAAKHIGPVFVRLGRAEAPKVYKEGDRFPIGGSKTLREGTDVAIIANGLLVAEAVKAAGMLEDEGISAGVIDAYSIRPLDEASISAAARKAGAVVVAEEHLLDGGLGSRVAMALARSFPVPMEFVGLDNTYAESGSPAELLEKYRLTAPWIAEAARRSISGKKTARSGGRRQGGGRR